MLLIIFLYVLFVLVFVTVASRYRAAAAQSKETWQRTQCSYCGSSSVAWDGQFCSYECEARLAKSMDAWHDRFEEMDKD